MNASQEPEKEQIKEGKKTDKKQPLISNKMRISTGVDADIMQMMTKSIAGSSDTKLMQMMTKSMADSSDTKLMQMMSTSSSSAKGSGNLPENLQYGVESLSGQPMDDVHVHYNSPKPNKFGAAAYAQGDEIHLGPGQEQYLPHEAWHVAQQRQGRVEPTIQTKGLSINEDEALEKEADEMGEKATHFKQEAPLDEAPPAANNTGSSMNQLMTQAQNITKQHAIVQNKMTQLKKADNVQFKAGNRTIQFGFGVFGSTAKWVGNKVGDVIDGVKDVGTKLALSTIGSLSELVGFDLPESPWEALVTIGGLLGNALFYSIKLLIPGPVKSAIKNILAIYELIQFLLNEAAAIFQEIKDWFQARINETEDKAREELIGRGVPPSHLVGIWFYMQPMLTSLYETWWDSIKEGFWDLIWPIPGVWDEIQGMVDDIGQGAQHLWNLEFSQCGDSMLNVLQHVNDSVSRLYGWISFAIIASTTIAGAFAGGVGAVPGFWLGVGITYKLGNGLALSTIVLSGITLLNSIWSLSSIEEAEQDETIAIQNEIYYENIASNAIFLALMGLLMILGGITSRLVSSMVNRMKHYYIKPVRNRRRSTDVDGGTTKDYENYGSEYVDEGIRAGEYENQIGEKAEPMIGQPGSAEHKTRRWEEYLERGGEWSYERWSNTYDNNMIRARNAHKAADEYHKTLGWGKREVTVEVDGQIRRLDIGDKTEQRGVEFKSGNYFSLDEEIRGEIANDSKLVEDGWEIEWVIEGRASQPLIDALREAGIEVTILN